MAWEFEDTGKTRICRNVLAPYNTWAMVMSCVVTAIVGLPVALVDLSNSPFPQGDSS